jgi:ribosomal protein L11 methyltransferase
LIEPVRWVEARVLAPAGWTELVADALAFEPSAGAAFGRPSLASDPLPEGCDLVRAFIPERADSAALRRTIEERIASLAARTGAPELAGLRVEFRPLPPEDYAISWKKDWKPFRVGRIAVVTPGTARGLRPSDVTIRLEPGGAFGTGRHPTTRDCLRFLQARVRPGVRVLDAGSGSGILAVAAVRLGASSALGFDTDIDAKPYADELARENGVAERCEFRVGGFELLDDVSDAFDAVVSNIYADVIGAELPRIVRALRPGGCFVFSGCTEARAPQLVETISASELAIEEVRACGRWRTFAGVRARRSGPFASPSRAVDDSPGPPRSLR